LQLFRRDLLPLAPLFNVCSHFVKRLTDCQLYGILDLAYVAPASIVEVAAQMIEGGVDILQLRAKKYVADDVRWLGEQLHPVTQSARIPLVINDFPEVAAELGAEGVHVGQDDLSVEKAHALAGYRTIVGKSTHSFEQALAAARENADYIGFGPLFSTPTKPDYQPIGLDQIALIHKAMDIPIFCIGGIKLENLPRVLEAGARRVVIVSGILKAKEITGYCQQVKAMLGKI
jgi:thiamine-phosphate pyrophosphorylase